MSGEEISPHKIVIARAIEDERKRQGLSVRDLAAKAGLKHPQVIRVTSCKNYTRDTLFSILGALDLTMEVTGKLWVTER